MLYDNVVSIFFFFFKQKTAYEMRISDWSSDVCSSDLLQLESTDDTAMTAISWTYPQDQLLALRRRNENADAATPIASGVTLENLRFRYAISGDNPPWRPVRAFDAGSKVFIEFPGRSEERRVGNECVSTGRSRWWPYH